RPNRSIDATRSPMIVISVSPWSGSTRSVSPQLDDVAVTTRLAGEHEHLVERVGKGPLGKVLVPRVDLAWSEKLVVDDHEPDLRSLGPILGYALLLLGDALGDQLLGGSVRAPAAEVTPLPAGLPVERVEDSDLREAGR